MTRRVFFFILLTAVTNPGFGQDSDDPFRFVVWPLDDVRAIGRVDARWAAAAAGAGAGLLLLSRHDRPLTERSAQLRGGWGLRVVEEFGNAKAMRPAVSLVFFGSLMAGDQRLQDAAFTSLESVLLANLATNTLKGLFGRSRPWQNQGPNTFEPFSGRTSFPSGHATTAFAALTPFAQYYGGKTAIALYALATATAFSRMATNVHWFSDVVAGSAVGFTTGWALARRHRRAHIMVAPSPAGTTGVLELRF